MRDHLCDEIYLIKKIEFNNKQIHKKKEKVIELKADIENGIQKYPKDNQSILSDTFLGLFKYNIEMLRAKYSLGNHPDTMVDDYIDTITILESIGGKEVGYVHLLWMVSLGILFEINREELKRIACVVEKERIDDALMDFLLNASNIKWSHNTSRYEKENPYAKTAEIIQTSLQSKDKVTATKKLQKYMENEWFKGHYDYEWKNAHKEPGYVGFWSFETAALVKILKLDDKAIKENNHYPYELTHYKHEMSFNISRKSRYLEKEMNDAKKIYGITNNPKLEQMIAVKYYDFVNNVINDYIVSSDEEFWKKYKLDEIWFDLEVYRKNNGDKNLLGTIIVFLLVDKGFILQLDYKDNLKDYIENIHNYWPEQEVKLVSFELNNDQNYYAYIPKNEMIDSMYEVKVIEVN